MKELVAKEVASRVRNGDVLGIGTGSTVDLALQEIGKRVASEKLTVWGVTTSYQSTWRCQSTGIKVLDSQYRGRLAWGFDGADAVDGRLRAIKGKGAAMLQEKILAARCDSFVLIVDQSKFFGTLDEAHCLVPIEIIPNSVIIVEQALKELGASKFMIRDAGGGKHGPVITEAGNLVMDAEFDTFPESLERDIKSIVGVVESGLFFNYAKEMLVGSAKGVESRKR